MLLDAKRRYRHLHSLIFGSISGMLGKAKLEPIEALQGLDPSFTSLVAELEGFRRIVGILSPVLGLNGDLAMIDDYIVLAKELAESIDLQDSDKLGAAISALDDRPYV